MFNTELGPMERYLDLLSARQKILSSNIANAETPGYRAQDFDFRGEFNRVLTEMDEGRALPESMSIELFETQAISPNRDGNTVSMEIEMAKMAENSGLYNTAAQILSMKMRMIRDAITSGR
ncbi:MAG: flagellar basal body rod protein FlgB [Nitrospirae bacterium]|nr:flagellar basal body rod protein FlgB [Nitrospirota bacterium]